MLRPRRAASDLNDVSPSTQERVALGIDLGGTKVEGAIVIARDGDHEVVARERIPTLREEGYEAVLARTAAFVSRLAASVGGGGDLPIGVGMPGGVERRTGLVKNSNTTCLNGRPFRDDLRRATGRSIVFENDANCFALAEAVMGAARDEKDGWIFGVILGTGVGGGWVADGRIVSGRHGIAGEWGHHAVRAGDPTARSCYCGQRGCLEAYASGPAVERSYLAASGMALSVAEIAAVRASDGYASDAIEGLVDAFGRALANVIDIADPACVVLGGGLSNLELLYTEGRARVARYVFNDELLTPILKHELGDSAGVLGAALLALA